MFCLPEIQGVNAGVESVCVDVKVNFTFSCNEIFDKIKNKRHTENGAIEWKTWLV